jgi:hypothetical protein
MAFKGERIRTAQQPTMRGPLRSPTTSSSVSSRRPPATPLSTRARCRRVPLFRALRTSPASSLLFADESPLMRRVDDSRSLPPLREGARRLRPTTLPLASRRRDSLHCAAAATLATPAGRPRQARPGSFRGHQPITQYCLVQYAIHTVRPPRAHATAPGDAQRHINAAPRRERPAGALPEVARPSPPWSRRRALAQNRWGSLTRRAIITHSRSFPFIDGGV